MSSHIIYKSYHWPGEAVFANTSFYGVLYQIMVRKPPSIPFGTRRFLSFHRLSDTSQAWIYILAWLLLYEKALFEDFSHQRKGAAILTQNLCPVSFEETSLVFSCLIPQDFPCPQTVISTSSRYSSCPQSVKILHPASGANVTELTTLNFVWSQST